MEFLLLAVVLAAIAGTVVYMRHRPTRDPGKSVAGFRRAMSALEPKKPKRTRIK